MADLFNDSFDVWDDVPFIPSFALSSDSVSESFESSWDNTPPAVVEEQPEGRSFFLFRSCDITATGARSALIRNTDVLNRALALLDKPGGLPDEEAAGSDNPTLDVIDAEWGPTVAGDGTLPPGTYTYDGIPLDTCTGRTGAPIPLPALTISALGDEATLRVRFNNLPDHCDALQIRRDGEIVGPPFPMFDNISDNLTVVNQPDPFGNYDIGTRKNFRWLGGADLIGGDVINYNGFTVKVDRVLPHSSGTGLLVRFEPQIPASLITPPGFFDAANRTGFYESFSTFPSVLTPPGFPGVPGTPSAPMWPPGTPITWAGPISAFVKIPPSTFGLLPFLDDLQPGDIIAYGSKTALVVYVESNPLAGLLPGSTDPKWGTVLCIPFGILPLPPMPAGQYWVVYRSGLAPTFFVYYTLGAGFADFDDPLFTLLRLGRPTFQGGSGIDSALGFLNDGTQNNGYDPADIPNPRNAQNCFRVATFDVVEDPAGSSKFRPAFLFPGQSLIYDATTVTVSFVNEIQPPDGLFPGEYEIEVTPGISPSDFEILPDLGLPGTPVTIPRPVMSIGAATTIPSFESVFLQQPVIEPAGQFERITRLLTFTSERSVWSFRDTGDNQDRAGFVLGSDARDELDAVFNQNNYEGGLDGLLERVRGPQDTPASDVFVKTVGTLTRTTNRIHPVNSIAALGGDSGGGILVSLDNIRDVRSELCDNSALFTEFLIKMDDPGYAVMRIQPREVQVPAAQCPPGQPDQREVKLVCVGFATPQVPVQDGEVASVFWAPNARFGNGVRLSLRRLGLTDDEVTAALSLITEKRIVSVREFSTTVIDEVDAFNGISSDPGDLDDIMDDVRIVDIHTGTVNRYQIQEIIRRRGRAGITSRPTRTDPASADDPTQQLLDDFTLPAHQLASLALQLQLSFDICDYDAAIASIKDPELRAQVAAFFAVAEGVLNQLVQAGRSIHSFLTQSDFAAAADAIAGIIAASATDPTLSCLGGPQAYLPNVGGLPNFRSVDGFFSLFAQGFQTRFNLSQLFATAISSVLCSIIGAFVDMISFFGGNVAGAVTKKVIGCLPSVEDLAGVSFPSLDAQIAIECSLEQLNMILDIINALIAEANEVIDFANNLETGFVTQTVEARNRACSSGEGIASLIGGLRVFVGL